MEQKIDPKVFVSYSWDSGKHKEKVRNFVMDLRLHGIDVIYDGDLHLGERLQYFMENSISKSDIVLFICTPNYKQRADNRIAGVGYENQIISSELFETCNEKKFIPILFGGTWETSLPIWAKGKLGIDLSTPQLYAVNYQTLLVHLQNDDLYVKSSESATQQKDAKTVTKEKPLDESNPERKFVQIRGTLATVLGKIFNNTILGRLLLALVISGTILFFIPLLLNKDDNYIPEDNLGGASSSTTPVNSTPGVPAINGSALDSPNLDDPVPSNITSGDIISNFDDDILSMANGTMPRGTMSVTIPITDELREKLAVIQELSIGNSKAWIDDKLGPPFAEKVMSTKNNRLIRSAEDESNKTGDVLVCVYNISYIVAVQVYFDTSDNSCQGFFITLLKDVSDIEIAMPKLYTSLFSDKSIGEFSFSQIGEVPAYAYGFSSTGDARTFYGEEHYFGPFGNYRTFYCAVLDYGMLDSRPDFILFLSRVQLDIAPNIDTVYFPLPEALSFQRDKFYPNTCGISILDYRLTFDLLSQYWWFDSLALSNKTE